VEQKPTKLLGKCIIYWLINHWFPFKKALLSPWKIHGKGRKKKGGGVSQIFVGIFTKRNIGFQFQ